MTNKIQAQNQQIPPYAGITINITSPSLNPVMAPQASHHDCNHVCSCPIHNQNPQQIYAEQNLNNVPQAYYNQADVRNNNSQEVYGYAKEQYDKSAVNEQYANNTQAQNSVQTNEVVKESSVEKITQSENVANQQYAAQAVAQNQSQEALPQAYPQQYYLNNYNYVQGDVNGTQKPAQAQAQQVAKAGAVESEEPDMSISEEIISDVNERIKEQADLEKNGKQVKVTPLTNEYIMSLENYLNSENDEIRIMGGKEVLKRLNEDRTRFDDAALNALLNKMLQDPNKLVRILALSAFSSELASGNDYTAELLTNIQNNPQSDKEDVLQASAILLQMSASTEIKYVPVENKK